MWEEIKTLSVSSQWRKNDVFLANRIFFQHSKVPGQREQKTSHIQIVATPPGVATLMKTEIHR
ncbi:hypothetical protein HOY82DRAFT_377917 [Tuber indicum]|nr:hypothetical protein HOY82DRAFT_377917 [Tuber indicum]